MPQYLRTDEVNTSPNKNPLYNNIVRKQIMKYKPSMSGQNDVSTLIQEHISQIYLSERSTKALVKTMDFKFH